MGMYTEFHFNSELKEDTPSEVINLLKWLLWDADQPEPLPVHPFFECDRRRNIFTGDSYYFDAQTYSILEYDSVSESYFLCVRSNLKNYDSEIQKFCDWIRPYLNKTDGDFLGFSRYEETGTPTLIYYFNKSIKRITPEIDLQEN